MLNRSGVSKTHGLTYKAFRKNSVWEKINRASDDPVGAVNLSAAKEQKEVIRQFLRNTGVAHTRLD